MGVSGVSVQEYKGNKKVVLVKTNIWNVPNFITIIRLILIVPFVYCLFAGMQLWAVVLFLTIVLGDGIDGFLARALKQTPPLGSALDGVVDGIFLVVIVLSFYFFGRLHIAWIIVFLVPKILNFVMQASYSRQRKKLVTVKSTLGKFAMTTFYLTMFLILVSAPYTTYFLTLTAIFIYVAGFRHLMDIPS